MTDASQHEQLLTALMDGELQGEERMRAESILNEHPEYQALLKSWREQTAVLRRLPQYRLDEGFAFRVLREVLVPPGNTTPVPTSAHHWKLGLAAIGSLAALLLLTLFVFPKLTQPGSVADAQAENSDATSQPATDSAPSLPLPGSDEIATMNFDGSTTFENNQSTADAPRIPVTTANQNRPRQIEAGGVGEPVPGIRTANPSPGFGQQLVDDMLPGGPAKDPTSRSSDNVGSAANKIANQIVESTENLGGRKAAIHAADSKEKNASPQSISVVNSIDQVIMIELDRIESPWEKLEQILKGNAIQVIGEDLNGSDDETQLAGLKAVYVIASRSQFKNAVRQLSGYAQISGFQMPQGVALQQAMQLARSQSGSQGAENPIKAAITASDSANDVQLELPQSSVSLAQPLQATFSFSATADVNNNSESGFDAEIAELDAWFNLASEDDDQVNQYLLLIHLSPSVVDSAAESSK